MTENQVSALLYEAIPDQGPALDVETVLQGARRRQRARFAAATVAIFAAVTTVPLLLSTTHTRGDSVASSPSLPPAPGYALPTLRPLPKNALLQLTFNGGLPRPMPQVPAFTFRLYKDGRLLAGGGSQDAPWLMRQLPPDELTQVRDLLHRSALDEGGKDYGTASDHGVHGDSVNVLQVSGAQTSVVLIGPIVNGAKPTYPGLTPAQRLARAAAERVIRILFDEGQLATEKLAINTWSRYVDHDPTDNLVYPTWTSGTLTAGCTAVANWRTEVSTPYRPSQSPFRYKGSAWFVTYDAVLPGEHSCWK
jgi:hypothetical protein